VSPFFVRFYKPGCFHPAHAGHVMIHKYQPGIEKMKICEEIIAVIQRQHLITSSLEDQFAYQ